VTVGNGVNVVIISRQAEKIDGDDAFGNQRTG